MFIKIKDRLRNVFNKKKWIKMKLKHNWICRFVWKIDSFGGYIRPNDILLVVSIY